MTKSINTENLPKMSRMIFGEMKEFIDWRKSEGVSVDFVYDDITGKILINKYNTDGQQLFINYNGVEYKMTTSNFLKCKLGKILNKHTSNYKIQIGQNFKDLKRDITIIDRKCTNSDGKWRKYYKYKCNKCGYECGRYYSLQKKRYYEELWMDESGVINGNGCACCCTSSIIVVDGINDIYTTDRWMTPIINDIQFMKTHTRNSNDEIYPICPYCNKKRNRKVKIIDISKRHSIGCNCGDGCSRISKYIYDILEQLQECRQIYSFQTEVMFEWCKFFNPYKNKETYGRYDFCVEDKKILIEADGGFHRQDNTLGKMKLEERIYLDNSKDKAAKENGYTIIRISDKGKFKDNVICSFMNKIFDLSVIDWKRALDYSTSNLVKIASEYKQNNPNMTAKDIADIMKYDKTSIIKWLKSGTELGWCKYDGNEEVKRAHEGNAVRNKKRCSKQVKVFKDGEYLGTFESCCELERKSKQIFNTKLCNSLISSVANGKTKQYKGFIFSYE